MTTQTTPVVTSTTTRLSTNNYKDPVYFEIEDLVLSHVSSNSLHCLLTATAPTRGHSIKSTPSLIDAFKINHTNIYFSCCITMLMLKFVCSGMTYSQDVMKRAWCGESAFWESVSNNPTCASSLHAYLHAFPSCIPACLLGSVQGPSRCPYVLSTS